MGTEREPAIGDLSPEAYDRVVAGIEGLQHAWDLEHVQRPDLYGPPPKSVWKRLKRHQRRAKS